MDEELLFPALAAKALGVSPATLRRYAQAWEATIGPLPRAARGGRLWPRSALARLAAARELAQRKGLLLEEALLRVEGEPPPLVATPRPEEEVPALLREVLDRVEALEGEVRALKEENARLREALRALKPPKKRPWWRFWG
jgi:DNA-binding transcriptional MerR regulator